MLVTDTKPVSEKQNTLTTETRNLNAKGDLPDGDNWSLSRLRNAKGDLPDGDNLSLSRLRNAKGDLPSFDWNFHRKKLKRGLRN
ncbi:hypothetical protein QL285_006641 [Trifolium repens]|jgi:hypothetical protein|nr:hypothetical protein QL285_006641 [Trifolium repens]